MENERKTKVEGGGKGEERYLSNPFEGGAGHDCFGCAQGREVGLRLRFAEEGEQVVCRWVPDRRWQGWDGVLHGGIATTVLDETAGWAVLRRFQRVAMTTRIEVKFLHPTPAEGAELVSRAWFTGRVNEKIVALHATLEDGRGTICAEADAEYYVMDEARSRAMGFTACVPEGAERGAGSTEKGEHGEENLRL